MQDPVPVAADAGVLVLDEVGEEEGALSRLFSLSHDVAQLVARGILRPQPPQKAHQVPGDRVLLLHEINLRRNSEERLHELQKAVIFLYEDGRFLQVAQTFEKSTKPDKSKPSMLVRISDGSILPNQTTKRDPSS